MKIKNQVKKVGNLYLKKGQSGIVYSLKGIYQTVCAGTHGYNTGQILVNKPNSNIK